MKRTERANDLKFNELTKEEAAELGEVIVKIAQEGFDKVLPPEEIEAYKEAQQSVVDARRLAPLNEGNIYII